MNPLGLMKLMNEKKEVAANHPEFLALVRNAFGGTMKEGTKITLSITKPGQNTAEESMTVQPSDLKFFKGLEDLFG